MPPATVVPTPGRDLRIQEVDIEADVNVSVGGESVERQLHDSAHAHLVDGAHVEHRQLLIVNEAPLAGIDAADAHLPHPLRPDGRRGAAQMKLRRPEAAQGRDRHAVQAPAGTQFARVEVRVRVEPQHPQRPARLAAAPRHRRNGADRQAVIAAQQDRQPRGFELPIHRGVHLAVPRRNLAQIPIAVDPLKSGVRRPAHVAAIHDLQTACLQRRVQPRDPQRLRTHRGAAIARADIRGRTDETRHARERRAGGGGAHCCTATGCEETRKPGSHAESTRAPDFACASATAACAAPRGSAPSFSSP